MGKNIQRKVRKKEKLNDYWLLIVSMIIYLIENIIILFYSISELINTIKIN